MIGGGTIGPFAITAGVIGLLAGIWGYLGVYRSRPASGTQLLLGRSSLRQSSSSWLTRSSTIRRTRSEHRRLPRLGLHCRGRDRDHRGRRGRRLHLPSSRHRRPVGRDRRRGHWHRGCICFGADRRDRLWRRHRIRHGPDRCGSAPRRRGRPAGVPWPGTVQRPDRQADHELRRLHHPVEPVVALPCAIPAGRPARTTRARDASPRHLPAAIRPGVDSEDQ